MLAMGEIPTAGGATAPAVVPECEFCMVFELRGEAAFDVRLDFVRPAYECQRTAEGNTAREEHTACRTAFDAGFGKLLSLAFGVRAEGQSRC